MRSESELSVMKSGTNWREKYERDMKQREDTLKSVRLQLKEALEKVSTAENKLAETDASYKVKFSRVMHLLEESRKNQPALVSSWKSIERVENRIFLRSRFSFLSFVRSFSDWI
jgi:uncharacterized coiled-coil DUF342 family protein